MSIEEFIEIYYSQEYQNFLAKRKRINISTLTNEELFLIWHYTGSAYEDLNEELRQYYYSQSYSLSEEAKFFEQYLNQALMKLNPYQGISYRGISNLDEEVLKAYTTIDNIFSEPAFVSTTKAFGVANKWIKMKNPHKILFTIQGKSGRDVDNMSQLFEEKEVLFPSNCSFKVNNVRFKKGQYEIVIEEI